MYLKISLGIRHIYRWKSGIDGVVYLDDGLQIGHSEDETNDLLSIFLGICSEINLPIAEEKTERARCLIKFLGLLIDAIKRTVEVPSDKVAKVLNQIESILAAKKSYCIRNAKNHRTLKLFHPCHCARVSLYMQAVCCLQQSQSETTPPHQGDPGNEIGFGDVERFSQARRQCCATFC